MMNGEQTLGDMCLYLKSGALGEIRTHGLCLPRIGFGFSHYLHDSTTEQVVAITSFHRILYNFGEQPFSSG